MKKSVLVGLLTGATILGVSVGGYAASNFHLIVNGNEINADVQVIDGKSYVPLRAIGEALGEKVDFDGSTNTITISNGSGDSSSSVPAQSSDSSVGLSRDNPAGFGQTVTVVKKDITDEDKASITLENVIRGDQAWQMIQKTNMFNNAPKDGYEYILAKINFNFLSGTNGKQLHLSSTGFKLVSSQGKDYDSLSVVVPDPKIDADLYPGASSDGWVAFEVSKDDQNPLIAFGRHYDGTGGAWFKLSN